MDERPTARPAAASERTTDMADLRKCTGSARFGIEPHEAPVDDFPKQPSQKDGLGRMCKSHWNQYTAGLARDAKARKVEADGDRGDPVSEVTEPAVAGAAEPAPKRTRRAPASLAAVEDEAVAG
jgi:hypothetical protein